MNSSKLTANGQVTIPRELRERLNLKPGDQVEFMPGPGKSLLLYAHNQRTDLPEHLRGVDISQEELHVLLTGTSPPPARDKPAH
jgi:AbrB family looped-hinge helix DNA binding protein